MSSSFNDLLPPVPTRSPQLRGISKRTLIVGCGLIVALIIGGLLLGISASSSLQTPLQRLTARLQTLQSMINTAQPIITQSDLQKITSDASLLVTGSLAELEAPMIAAGRGTLSDENKQLEADTVSIEELRAAQLRGTYDVTFARIFLHKIDTVIALLNELYNKTNNASLKAKLSTSYANFTSLKTELTALKL